MLAAGQAGLPCSSFLPPQAVKHGGVRVRAGEQEQVQRMVAALLSLAEPPEPDHAADALAVAVCHALCPPLLRVTG